MPKRNGNTGSDNGGKPIVNGPEVIGNGGETVINAGTADSGNSAAIVNPGAIGHNPDTATGSAPSGDSQPRKRGRPFGSRNKRAETGPQVDLSGLQGLISSGHMFIAALTKNPLWALDEREVKAYAEAVQNVSRHYDIAVQQKTIDHAMLFVVIGGIYGTRIMTMQRMKAEKPAVVDDAAAAEHARGNPQQYGGQPLQ